MHQAMPACCTEIRQTLLRALTSD